jgi:DNA mismatch repair protein MutS
VNCREKLTTLNQDAPVAVAKGNAISGVNEELDELRPFLTQGKEF